MASIKVRTTAKGERRYDVRYRTSDGTSRKATFKTRRQAENHADSVEVDKRRGVFIDPALSTTKFGDWAQLWLDGNPAKRESTRSLDEIIIRKHLEPLRGRALGSISPSDIQRLVNRWTEQVQPRTVRRQYETLRAILTAAVNADYIGRTPCRGIKLPRVRPLRRPTIDVDDLEQLADALGDLGPMVWLASVLGLRWGECAGLKVGALDLLAETLSVIEVQARGRKGRPYASEPKSDAGRRTMTIPKPLVEILAHHLAHRGVTAADADALVFVAPGGGQLHYGTWRTRCWLPAVAECGLEDLTFHDLRRANATAMVAEGIDLKTAQTRFGHSDVRLTIGLYAQATAAADQAAASALGTRMMPRRTRKRSSRSQ